MDLSVISPTTPFLAGKSALIIDTRKSEFAYKLHDEIKFIIWKRHTLPSGDEFILGYVEFKKMVKSTQAHTLLHSNHSTGVGVLIVPIPSTLTQEKCISLCTSSRPQSGDGNLCTGTTSLQLGTPRRNKHVGNSEKKMTKGETTIAELLTKYGVKYEVQFRPVNGPRHASYDFFFVFHGSAKPATEIFLQNGERRILLEYDGSQHFEETPFFHRTPKAFSRTRKADITKTKWAIANGYYLVRIDYTCLDTMAVELVKALKSESKIYFSNVEMYKYISMCM